MNPDDEQHYRAFISYSHHDSAICAKLHRRLESYRTPKELLREHAGEATVPERLHPVFRDRDELATSSSLPAAIKDALRRSENLVVICSPAAAASKWVNAEVAHFVEMGRSSRSHPVIVAGEPPHCASCSMRSHCGGSNSKGRFAKLLSSRRSWGSPTLR
jgi:hypothetical protein